MTTAAVDLEKLRVALHRMSRGNLLIVAERAIGLVPRAKLGTLIGDFIRLDDLAKTKSGAAPILAEVRKFHEASMRGDYYESFGVNSKNFMDKSEGRRRSSPSSTASWASASAPQRRGPMLRCVRHSSCCSASCGASTRATTT